MKNFNIKLELLSDEDYVKIAVDKDNKEVGIEYVRNNEIIMGETASFSILDGLSDFPLMCEIYKQGSDVAFSIKRKVDEKWVSVIVSITADIDLSFSGIIYENEDEAPLVIQNLKMYETQQRTDRNIIKRKRFNDTSGVTGVSSTNDIAASINEKGLVVGAGAKLNINMSSTGIDSGGESMNLVFKFGEVPDMGSTPTKLLINVGANNISINGTDMYVNGAYVCSVAGMLPMHRIVVVEDRIVYNGKVYETDWFESSFTQIGITNTGESVFTIEEIYIAKMNSESDERVILSPVVNLQSRSGYKEALLTWDIHEDENIIGYNVYMNGVKVNADLIAGTSYEVSGLEAGIEKVFAVAALSKSGVLSSPSEIVKVTSLSTEELMIKEIKIEEYDENHIEITFDKNVDKGIKGIRVTYVRLADNTQATEVFDINEEVLLKRPKKSEGRFEYRIASVLYDESETEPVVLTYLGN